MNTAVNTWLKNSVRNKKRLNICTMLICLVVAPVVAALIFSESMMNGIAGKYIRLSTGHLYAPGFIDNEIDESKLNELTSIYSCDAVINGNVLLYSSSSTAGCKIKGIKQDYFNDKRTKEIKFEIADFTDSSNLRSITISKQTAEKLNVSIGDKVAMMVVPDSAESVLRPVMVRVESIFHTGYDQLDSLIAFIDFDYAKELFPNNVSSAYEILVNEKDVNNLDNVISQIGNSEGIYKWDRLNTSVYRNFQASREAIFIVLLTIIFVAAFYSASVAQQLIQDDISDIAIMKLIGSDNRLVTKWAFSTVMFVTLKGIAFGLFLGFALSFGLSPVLKILSESQLPVFSNYLLDFDINVPFLKLAEILLIFVFVSALSVRISLLRTQRIKPIKLFTE